MVKRTAKKKVTCGTAQIHGNTIKQDIQYNFSEGFTSNLQTMLEGMGSLAYAYARVCHGIASHLVGTHTSGISVELEKPR